MWRRICVELETTPTHLQWLAPFTCSTCPDGALQRNKQRGAQKNKIRKSGDSKRHPCPEVLEHFDQQYSEELGDLWAPARGVLLDPPSWQYGVMLNRFSSVTDITQILLSRGFSSLLPQTDVPELFRNDASTVSNSTHQKGADTLSHPCSSKCRPEDFRLLPCITSHPFRQPHQSELSLNLPHSSLQCYIHPRPLRFPSQAHRPGQLKQYYLLNAASLLPVLALQVRDGDTVLDLCSAPGGKAVAIMQSATPALLCCNEPDPHRRDWLAKTLESFLPPSLSSRVMVSAQDGRSFGQSEAGFYDKGSFNVNFCFNAAWSGGDQPEVLLRCNGSPGCFDSGLQITCVVESGVSHLPPNNALRLPSGLQVLVDAPCSNDRSWLHSSCRHQGQQRLEDRARLPVLQTQLLRSAISAVRPGGVVVYSTCTLSSLENSAVVEAVLDDFPGAEAESLWEEIALPLSKYFAFISRPGHKRLDAKPSLCPPTDAPSCSHDKLGILVVPQPGKTWGPMFLSRIRKKG